MEYNQIVCEQGWDEQTEIIILKGALDLLDPTGQHLARYAAQCAAEENAEADNAPVFVRIGAAS